ncbi:MAG: glycosyltransferase 87 family protein [Planctomycetota bacterium]|jgi:hypothetical protein
MTSSEDGSAGSADREADVSTSGDRPGDEVFGPRLLGLLVGLLLLLGLVFGGYQSWRALEEPGPRGAIDLRNRFVETEAWFEGKKVYARYHDAMYPPASYALLAPAIVPFKFPTARIVWFCFELLCVVAIVLALIHACGARAPNERRLWAFMVLGTYPLGASIGNGQLGAPTLAALLGMAVLLGVSDTAQRVAWGRGVLAACLLLVALAKPTLAAPFFWVLLVRGGWRAAVACVLGYVALTFAASWPQDAGPIDLLRDWVRRAEIGARYGASVGEGAIKVVTEGGGGGGGGGRSSGLRITHVNAHSLLSAFGLAKHGALVTLAALAALGAWVGVFRRAHLWVLIGSAGVVARSMSYHAWYDDVVLILPLVALWRLAKGLDHTSPALRRAARLLFGLDLALLLAPGGIYALPRVPANIVAVTHALALLATLVLFAAVARRRENDARA